MELRSKFFSFLLILIFAASSYGFSSPREADTSTSAPNADALAMLEERFASLSGSMGKMTTLPKLSGTLSLPPQIKGEIHLPGDGVLTQQSSKEKKS